MAAGARKSATRFYSIYSKAVGHVHRSGQKLGLTPAMRTSSVAPVENVPLPARRVSIRLGSGMAVLFSTSKVPAASMFLPCVKFHSARFTCPYVVSVARIWHGARGRLKEHFRCLGDAVEKVGHLLFDRVEAGGMSRRPPPCSKRWVLLRSARRLHDVVEADECYLSHVDLLRVAGPDRAPT